jgi:hypothetical protein
MKATLSLVALCAALALPMFATAQSTHRLGITAGWNMTQLHSNVLTTTEGRGSATAGFTFKIPFGTADQPKFEYTQDIMYTQGGGAAETMFLREEQAPGTANYQYHFRSFEGTSMVGFNVNSWLQVQGGGYLGLMSNRLDDNNKDLLLNDNPDMYQCTPAYKLNHVFGGLDFGPAAGISVGTERVRLNARYHYGMRNLYNNIDFKSTKGKHIRTSAVRLSLSFFL